MNLTDDDMIFELRSLFEDLGDAALGGADDGTQALRSIDDRRRRPITVIALAVAAAGVIAIAGAVVVRQADAPEAATSVPQTAPAAQSTNPVEQAPIAFRDLVATVLPAGFVAMYNQRDALEVVAYNTDGVRLSVYVDVGDVEGAAKGIPLDEGSALSPDGDRIMAEVLYNYSDLSSPDPASLESVLSGRAAIPAIVAAVAEKFTGAVRTTILDSAYPRIDSEQLRAAIDAALPSIVGPNVGERVRGAGDFALMYSNDATYVTINAVRTDRSLPDGISSPGSGALTGLRWVNGWQIIVVSNPMNGHDALDEAVMQQILTTIEPSFTAWQPVVTAEAGCTTHTVEVGDSSPNVAERYGVTLDQLKQLNPDLEASFNLGAVIQIPCKSVADQPTSSRPDDLYRPDGDSKPDWSFDASNGIVRSSQRLTYTVSGGTNDEQSEGAIRIAVSTFDRTFVRDTVIDLSPCDGPTLMVDDLTAPLDRVPFTCANDARVFTIDLYSGQSELTTGSTSFDGATAGTTSTTTTTTP